MHSRSHRFAFVALLSLATFHAISWDAHAQVRVPIDIEPIESDDAGEPIVIDVLKPATGLEPPTEVEVQECRDEQDAGVISGEIIVCRELQVDNSDWFSGSRAEWEADYARRTAFANDLRPPDVAGAGIFRGPPTVGGLCLLGPCPKPPAILIDLEALEIPPTGSDADRIAQGLAPKGKEVPPTETTKRLLEAELGLPAPAFENENGASLEGSGEPAEPR